MTREDIYTILEDWFSSGILVSRKSYKDADVYHRSNMRELSFTPYQKVIFVGDSEGSDVFDKLKMLYDNKRVMSPLMAKVEKGLRTHHKLKKAVKEGTLMRFEFDDVVLYID